MMNRNTGSRTVMNENISTEAEGSALEQRVASGGSVSYYNQFPVAMPDCTQLFHRESSLGSYAGDFMALMQSNNSYQQQPPSTAVFATQSNPLEQHLPQRNTSSDFPIDSFSEAERLADAGFKVEHALQNKNNVARAEPPSTRVDSPDATEQASQELPIEQVGPPPANDEMVRPLSPAYTIVAAAPAQNGGGKELRRVADDNDNALSVSSSCTSGSVFRLEDLEEDSDDDDDYEEPQGRQQQRTARTPRNTTRRKRGGALLTSKDDQQVNRGTKRRCRRVYEPEVKVYVQYKDEDVLCQRGGLSNGHPGNIMYLKAKQELQPKYFAATKTQKTYVSQELVDRVHAWGGRFLKKDCNKKADEEQWYEVHNHAARTKAGQALREEYTPEKGAAKRNRYAKKK